MTKIPRKSKTQGVVRKMSNMERLTKNNYEDDLFELQKTRKVKVDEYSEIGYSQYNYNNDLWNKVKAIEDIEEELGINLTTLFKALKNGIFVEEQNTTEKEIVFEQVTFFYNYKMLLFKQPRKEIGKGRNISQYGKTWALTKEELEDDNK